MPYPLEEISPAMLYDNVRIAYLAAHHEDRRYGEIWYETANTFCWGLVQKYGLTVQQAAGVVAALSPASAWETNMLMAERVARGDTGRIHRFKDSDNKARKIMAGWEPQDMLGGNKVKSFYDNLVRPLTSPAVTIDRHAHDAAIGRVATARERDALQNEALYEKASQAYIAIAHEYDILPHQVQATVWLSWRNRKRG